MSHKLHIRGEACSKISCVQILGNLCIVPGYCAYAAPQENTGACCCSFRFKALSAGTSSTLNKG